ncbi:MAG: homoserine dehydrogenase [Candidatus Kapabacteria bacterium]|jgi:homoserine dehydrogenase|nr:homoserine dehydrogenase [Candidatus Kapabacteria bacterium]
MASNTLRIGLFGFGVVGQGLYDVLRRTPGLRSEIVRIGVKDRSKQRTLEASRFTFDPDVILDDPEIDIVVELIDDAEAAFNIVSTALRRGKAVVTANKRLVATRFEELLSLQRETGRPLLYEAAVAGSIPIIRNLEEYYDNDLLRTVSGIVNGTTNFILTKLTEDATGTTSYADVVRQAQKLGFAESDPTLDVEAFDAAFKTHIIAAHAFGAAIGTDDVFRRGIAAVTPYDIQTARHHDAVIKLVARVRLHGKAVTASALPALVHTSHPLARISNEYNAVSIEAAFSDSQLMVGKGAGSHPTASAVLSDIAALRYDYRYEYKKIDQGIRPTSTEEVSVTIYVRSPSEDVLRGVPFTSVDVDHRSQRGHYIIGSTTLRALRRSAAFADPDTFIAVVGDEGRGDATPSGHLFQD